MPRLSKIGAAALAAFGWTSGASGVSASYLVVAGGGGGGSVNKLNPPAMFIPPVINIVVPVFV